MSNKNGIETVVGDGSCFFHAVVQGLRHTTRTRPVPAATGRELHRLVMKRVQDGLHSGAIPTHFLDDGYRTSLSGVADEEKKKKYGTLALDVILSNNKDALPTMNHWAHYIEIQTTSMLLGQDIEIRRAGRGTIHIETQGDRHGSPIVLEYDGEHYNLNVRATKELASTGGHDPSCFFDAVLQSRPYVYPGMPIESTVRQLHIAAMMHVHNRLPRPVKNVHRTGFARRKTPQNRVLEYRDRIRHLQAGLPPDQDHAPGEREIQAVATITGHPVVIYTQHHHPTPNKNTVPNNVKVYTPPARRDQSLKTPVVIRYVDNARCPYVLDVERTRHWSLYGALVDATPQGKRRPTPDAVYTLVKKKLTAMVRDDPDKYRQDLVELFERHKGGAHNPDRDINEYLEMYDRIIPEHVSPVEVEAIATVLNRRVTVQVPHGRQGRISKVPPSNPTKSISLVLSKDGRYVAKHTTPSAPSPQKVPIPQRLDSTPIVAPVAMQQEKREDIKELDEIKNVLTPVFKNTTRRENERRPNSQRANSVAPDESPVDSYDSTASTSILDRLDNLRERIDAIDTPAEQRAADIDRDALIRDIVTYLEEHRPDMIPALAKKHPSLWSKFKRHVGSPVLKKAGGVVDRSSASDIGLSSVLMGVAMMMSSSYVTWWRLFTG